MAASKDFHRGLWLKCSHPRLNNEFVSASAEKGHHRLLGFGQQPCSGCASNNVECTIDATSDQRRTTELKRKLEDLEDDDELLRRLIRTLRHKNTYVDELVDFIRDQNPSLGQIKSFMDGAIDWVGIDKSPELLEVYEEVDRLDRLPVKDSKWALDITRLCDVPVFSVPARPWTNAYDDEFVSHLISMWFTWQHYLVNWIDRDMFLRDMKAGVLGSQFCSPLLVNAMLAEACFYSDYPEACAVRGDWSTRGDHFYQEARRLLDAEEGRISLTTVQGLGVLYSLTSMNGKDRHGWMYLVRTANATRVLRSMQPQLIAESNAPKETLERVLDNLEIGLFGTTTMGSLAWMKPPQMDKPSPEHWLPVHQTPDDTWVPYPRQDEPRPLHTNCIVNARASLGLIIWEMADFFFGDSSEKPPRADVEAAVEGWYARILDWREKFPPCIGNTDTEHCTAWVLSLHMYHHTLIMTLYANLKTTPPDADPATLESVARARERCKASALAVSELITAHNARWGTDRRPLSDMHHMVVSSYILMEDLSDPESLSAFLTLCTLCLPMTNRCMTLKGIFRLLQISMLKEHPSSLPAECIAVFREFETNHWRPEDRKRFNCLYPDFAMALKQKEAEGHTDDAEMDRVLEAWEHLSVSKVGKGNNDNGNHNENEDENGGDGVKVPS
ncbi:hypothetical protein BDV18DRAFT_157593 [Aspergillus unguis]